MYSLPIYIWMAWRRELNSWRTIAGYTLQGNTHITCVSLFAHSSQLGLILILIILACPSWSIQIFVHFGKICDPFLLTWNLLIASVLKEAQLNDNIIFITEKIHLKSSSESFKKEKWLEPSSKKADKSWFTGCCLDHPSSKGTLQILFGSILLQDKLKSPITNKTPITDWVSQHINNNQP